MTFARALRATYERARWRTNIKKKTTIVGGNGVEAIGNVTVNPCQQSKLGETRLFICRILHKSTACHQRRERGFGAPLICWGWLQKPQVRLEGFVTKNGILTGRSHVGSGMMNFGVVEKDCDRCCTQIALEIMASLAGRSLIYLIFFLAGIRTTEHLQVSQIGQELFQQE